MRKLIVLAVAAILVTAAATPASMLTLINGRRETPVASMKALDVYALKHSREMSQKGEIYHSTTAQMVAAAPDGWKHLGETVGKGGSIASLFDAFMASPGHAKIILDDYTHVGIGSVTKNGVVYITMFFAEYAAPPATTQPKPTTTTTILYDPLMRDRGFHYCYD